MSSSSANAPPPPPEWDMLLSAAQKNQSDRIRTMITQQGIPASHANGVGQSALHIACLWGHVDAVRVLLELGATPTAANRLTGATPLIMTLQSRKTDVAGKLAVIELLLAHGADAAQPDAYQQVPLDYLPAADVPAGHVLWELVAPQAPAVFQAIDAGDLSNVQTLVQADPSVASTAHRSETPVPHAVAQMVTLLDPSSTADTTQITTLAQIVECLLAAGATVTVPTPETSPFMGMPDAAPAPPLLSLLQVVRDRLVQQLDVPAGVTETCRALLPATSLSPDDVASLWHNAARRGQLAVLQWMYDTLAWHNILHATNRQGMTALHFGARSGRVAVVQWLLAQPGIDPKVADARGQTARDAAVANQHDAIVQLLDAAATS